jgi:hypothetical protein
MLDLSTRLSGQTFSLSQTKQKSTQEPSTCHDLQRSVDHAAIGGVHTKRLRAARSRNSLQGISFCSRVTARSIRRVRPRAPGGGRERPAPPGREDRPVGISAQLQGRGLSFLTLSDLHNTENAQAFFD